MKMKKKERKELKKRKKRKNMMKIRKKKRNDPRSQNLTLMRMIQISLKVKLVK
jgi:hypothetical protein